MIAFQVSVVSSYTNGSPWSVALGNGVFVSGAGSSLAWTQYSFNWRCGSTSSNTLAFKLQSNANRAASLLVDNLTLTAY